MGKRLLITFNAPCKLINFNLFTRLLYAKILSPQENQDITRLRRKVENFIERKFSQSLNTHWWRETALNGAVAHSTRNICFHLWFKKKRERSVVSCCLKNLTHISREFTERQEYNCYTTESSRFLVQGCFDRGPTRVPYQALFRQSWQLGAFQHCHHLYQKFGK